MKNSASRFVPPHVCTRVVLGLSLAGCYVNGFPTPYLTNSASISAEVKKLAFLVESQNDPAAQAIAKDLGRQLEKRGVVVAQDEQKPHHVTIRVTVGEASKTTASVSRNGARLFWAVHQRPNGAAGNIGDAEECATALAVDILASPSLLRVASSVPELPVAMVEGPQATEPAKLEHALLGSSSPNTHVLAIGISNYRDVAAAPGARADAERFAQLATKTMGVPEANVRLLVDEYATRSDMQVALGELERSIGTGGRAIVYYAGHGAPDPATGRTYLVPHEASPTAIERSGLSMDDLVASLEKSRATEVTLIVDACFSGAGGRSVLSRGARPLVLVKIPQPKKHLALFAASGASEISGTVPDGSSGLFTHHLLLGIGEARADKNSDGVVTLDELHAYVAPRVATEAREAYRDQHPALVGSGKTVVIASGLRVTGQ